MTSPRSQDAVPPVATQNSLVMFSRQTRHLFQYQQSGKYQMEDEKLLALAPIQLPPLGSMEMDKPEGGHEHQCVRMKAVFPTVSLLDTGS